METQDEVYNLICHYQKNLLKYSDRDDEEKMIYYINKLKKLPITVYYLQLTGVGKTVNSIRKLGGEVAKHATDVVSLWKQVVENENTERDNSSENEEGYESEIKETNIEYVKHSPEKNKRDSKSSHEKTVSRKDKRSKEKDSNNKLYVSKTENRKGKSSSLEQVKRDKEKKNKEESYNSEKKLDREKEKVKYSDKKKHKESKEEDNKKRRRKEDSHSNHSSKKSKSVSKSSASDELDGEINSGSGTSFAEALGMLEPSTSGKTNKKKEKSIGKSSPIPPKNLKTDKNDLNTTKKNIADLEKIIPIQSEPIDLNLPSLLPEITPNYRPMNNFCDTQALKIRKVIDDEALSAGITSKNQRTKVYSGNKCYYGKVSSLFDMCIRILQENIDALEFTGGVPFSILKPVLDRCTPDQLFMMEHHNPYLIEDTDQLWKYHCQKDFRTKKREEMETWRDMYVRCVDEREAKLRTLTSNIKQSQEKSQPVRQTKLAYVDSVAKPPRNIAKRQAKNGIENRAMVSPSARICAIATNGEAGKICVPNPGSRAANTASGSNSHLSNLKPKKAPLMQKALALIKNRFKR